MLLGPYSINSVDLYVTRILTRISAGVYVLSKDGKTDSYVGRSDTDVGSRIKESSREGYGYTTIKGICDIIIGKRAAR